MKTILMDYNQKDKQTAKKITYDLECKGVRVWNDEFDIKLGDNIFEKKKESIKCCHYILILLSDQSNRTIEYFTSITKAKKDILVLLIDNCNIPNILKEYPIIDLQEDYDDGLSNVLAHLKDKLESKRNQSDKETEKEVTVSSVDVKSVTLKNPIVKTMQILSLEQFFNKFSNEQEVEKYKKALLPIFEFAKMREAAYLLFGGSFAIEKDSPSNATCVIVFRHQSDIPRDHGRFFLEQTTIDVYFATIEDQNTLSTHQQLLSMARNNQGASVIKIDIANISMDQLQRVDHNISDNSTSLIDLYQPRGVLVTLHGLLSRAKWNTELAPIVSSQGWIFAPYVYKSCVDLLFREQKRKRAVDEFRSWIFDIQMRYKGVPISVIAHSFGTYIIASYLAGFDEDIPVQFQSVILTGSIVHTNYDWKTKYEQSKIIRVRNEIAKNDSWVKRMPDGIIRLSKKFGQSGVKGFAQNCDILTQHNNKIFDHNNVIKRDVVEQIWLPYLNANSNLDFLE